MSDTYSILVVEDEKPLLEIIQTKLESNGFEVATARTAEQALDYLESGMEVDVIWLDHYLIGEENGLSFLARIKKEEAKWKGIPVFLVSNTAGAETVQSYLRLGVEKYFTKADNRLDDIVNDIKAFLASEDRL
ncbi:MAG: response regulator [Candidatus Paceibacterota bacterium]